MHRSSPSPVVSQLRHSCRLRCCALAFLVALGFAPMPATEGAERSGMLQTDFPFQKACIGAPQPARNVANKGIAIRLENNAYVCFDTDLLRMSAGWTGDFITTKGVTYDGSHGGHPQIAGPQVFGTVPLPGWADRDGNFSDSRPEPYGPLPRAHAHWKGLEVSGMRVLLRYTVLGTEIAESPSSLLYDGETAFVRQFRFGPVTNNLTLAICHMDGGAGSVHGNVATMAGTGKTTNGVALVGGPDGAKLVVANGAILLQLRQGSPAAVLSVVIWKGSSDAVSKFASMAQKAPRDFSFEPGAPHWPEIVKTTGKLNTSTTPDGAYTVDQLTPPVDNPWKRRVRFGGLDFFADGRRAALSTWDGDIWIVSGIDETLQNLEWRRYASGGFETLGLAIVNDVIYTTGRDEITRYHDLNNDGAADRYENFNNDVTSSPGFHEFQFDLQTDRAGNFYTAKAGPVRGGGSGFGGGGGNGEVTRFAGTVQKVDPQGQTREIFATGFRAPNGIGVSPGGQVTTGDNEGSWVPACPLNWLQPGAFAGVEDTAQQKPIPPYQNPLCWMTKSWDNSGGGQAWITSSNWGPFTGELLHTSYGQSALYLVLRDKSSGTVQGGVVRIPVKLTSSAMRPKFNPRDGQLYNAGLRGWQSNAPKETGFDRIRYTGKPVRTVSGLHVGKGKIELEFTQPLDPASAADPENFSGEQWNYRRTSSYGSPEFSVSNPTERKHDPVEITAATLSADGRTVTLAIPELQPVHQLLLKYNVKTRDGAALKQELLQTIHVVPGI